MPRPVDVLLSPEELSTLGKKSTSCMRVDPHLLSPAMCVSKAGQSSAAMFGGHAQGGAQSTGEAHLSTAQYAQLFQKYYGGGSFVDKLVASQRGYQSAATAAATDAEINKRARRETKAKYLSARMAGKYGVEAPGITGPPPAAPPLLGLTLIPKTAQHAGSQQQDAGSLKVLEIAAQLAQFEAAQEATATEKAARRAYDVQHQTLALVSHGHKGSPAFKAPTREQAARTGSKFIESGQCAPGPGKYDVKWSYWQKDGSAPFLVPPDYGGEIKGVLAKKAAKSRAASARASEQKPEHDTISRSATRQARDKPADQEAEEWGNEGSRNQGIGTRPSSAPPSLYHPGVTNTTTRDKLKIFKDAHLVHSKPAKAEGTLPFKSQARPPLRPASAASHLALKYHSDTLDMSQRKAPQLVMPFAVQIPRPILSTGADTSAALGPGSYIGMNNMPESWTGKHVHAGHVGVCKAPNFAFTSPRPQSAKPAGFNPVSDVQYQQALQALAGDQLNPSDLIAIQNLQTIAAAEGQVQACIRPVSARLYQPKTRVAGAIRPDSAMPGSSDQAAAQMVASHTANTSLGGNAQVMPSSGLGMAEVDRYSSAGLRKPVRGGQFASTTRAQEIQGLRVVSDGKVIPPASAPLAKIRPSQAADVLYDPVEDTVQGHRPRSPAWQLPPNRAALSKQWVSAAALSYI